MAKKLNRAARSKQWIQEGKCGYCGERPLLVIAGKTRRRCKVCTAINRKAAAKVAKKAGA